MTRDEPAPETVARHAELLSTRAKVELWIAMLGAPAAGLMLVSWGFSASHAGCVVNSRLPVHAVAALALALALYSGWLAYRFWGRTGREWKADVPGPLGRARIMAGAGLLGAALFVPLILVGWAATAFLLPCQGS